MDKSSTKSANRSQPRNGMCRRRASTTPCTTHRRDIGASRRDRTRPRPACARSTGASPPGLLEACVQATTSAQSVLLVSYDLPYPEPLRQARPVQGTLGMAFLMSAPADRRPALAGARAGAHQRCAGAHTHARHRAGSAAPEQPHGPRTSVAGSASQEARRGEIVLDHLGATLSLRVGAG